MDHLTSDDAWLATGTPKRIMTRVQAKLDPTGHYASKTWARPPPTLSNIFAYHRIPLRPQLRRPADRTKDQTYYLAAVPEASLSRALFPLAPYKKLEVREMAQKWGLPTASREESMGICFVGEKRRFDSFICVQYYGTIMMFDVADRRSCSSVHYTKARTHNRFDKWAHGR